MKAQWVFPLSVVLALAGGAFAGYVDRHNDEVQPAAALLLGSAFLLGLLRPRTAWVPALILGLSIPATYTWAMASGVKTLEPISLPGTFIALIPAGVGALFGAAAGTGLAAATRRSAA